MVLDPIDSQSYLKDVEYPARKDDLVAAAQENGAPDDVVEGLQAMTEDSFDGPDTVMAALNEAGETSDG